MNSETSQNTSTSLRPSGRPVYRWWTFPWGYKESLAFVLGLLVVGIALQLIRPLDFNLLGRPVNFVILALLLIPPLVALLRPKNKFLLWLGSIPLSVLLVAAFLLLSMILGLTPQSPHPLKSPELAHRLGLTSLTSTWPFIVIQVMTMITLSVALALRLRRKGPKTAFILNHLGLWLLLAAAGLGAADRRSYMFWVEEEQVEWRGRTGAGLIVELPLAIKLHDFSLEQYPPKLFVINKNDGKTLPEGKPQWYQIEPERNIPGQLLGWAVTVEKYYHLAVRGPGGEYIESPRPDAAPAALISVSRGSEKQRGWITDGGLMQPFQTLALVDDLVLVMASPEPKRFSSDITVYTKDGGDKRQVVEVNKPLSLGPWMIYQHSYDDRLGRMSRNSGFEAVYDPWWPLARLSLWLMVAGAFLLIWGGRFGRRSNKKGAASGPERGGMKQ